MSSSVPSLTNLDGAERAERSSWELEAARAPFPIRPIVAQLRAEIDWDSFLPKRAHSLSWRLQQVVKRALDVLGASFGLVVFLPLMALIALVVKLTSRGPILYQWNVLGERARPFIGYKFRTMVEGADLLKEKYEAANEMSGPVFKMRADPRVTRTGAWLRKYSLDELPQLWSVLKGDMSLVGPRPVSAHEFERFKPMHRGKLAVRPGITCLWQIGGRNEIRNFEDWAALDRKYIQEWSLLLDLKILLLTIPAVIRARGAY